MLAHGIEVEERPARAIPQQIAPFEIAVADAFAQERREQVFQCLQFGLPGEYP